MTPGLGFTLGGTPVDRVGGVLRLRAIADELVGVAWSLEIEETGTHFHLFVVHETDGVVLEELRSVAVARSAAIRVDQRAMLEEDRVALEPTLRAWIARRELERLPESEKRLLDGNR